MSIPSVLVPDLRIPTTSAYRRELSTAEIAAIYGRNETTVRAEVHKQRKGGQVVFTVPRVWQPTAIERIDEFLSACGDQDTLDDFVAWASAREVAMGGEPRKRGRKSQVPVFTG